MGGGFAQQSTAQSSVQFGAMGTQQEAYKVDSNEIEMQHGFRDSISTIIMMSVSGPREIVAVSGWDGQLQVYMVQT